MNVPIPISDAPIDLYMGENYIGFSSPPSGYNSYRMLDDIGSPDVVYSISGFNPITGERGNTYWEFNRPSGDNFPIESGRGYKVFMKVDVLKWYPNKKQ